MSRDELIRLAYDQALRDAITLICDDLERRGGSEATVAWVRSITLPIAPDEAGLMKNRR